MYLIGFIVFYKFCIVDVFYFGECINSFIDYFFLLYLNIIFWLILLYVYFNDGFMDYLFVLNFFIYIFVFIV